MVHKIRVISLLKEIINNGTRCPAHSTCGFANTSKSKPSQCEYAFEMACSNIRYGPGVTKEIGMDIINFNCKKALLVTDKNVAQLPSFQVALDSLSKNGIDYDLYDQVNIEPTDVSMMHAVDYARSKSKPYDIFVAIGGGSVIDTCKVINLLTTDKEAELLDYVNVPIGKGKFIRTTLKPMIAVPTTSGTGSETTGVAIFDLISMKAKVGISQRALKPTLGIVDPDHTAFLPRDVSCYSGFDVLCHALESFTAIPYNQRTPCPNNPIERPAYQGSNPLSDVWSIHALKILSKFFRRSVNDPMDSDARSQMHLASALAGMGFGNAGVHLCHGMSYPISGLAKSMYPNTNDYKPVSNTIMPLIPHGLSVVITAPAVFQFTSELCPDRHLKAAQVLDPNISESRFKNSDSRTILSDVVRRYMEDLKVPDGLEKLGFRMEDIPDLVEGTLPQHRVTKLSPRTVMKEDLFDLFKSSMKIF